MGQIKSLTRQGDIPVLQQTDWDYSGIFGCVVLSTGNVMFTDYNNQKVKVINVEQGQIISSLALTSSPADVTTVQYTKAAVTLTDENRIQLLHVINRDTELSVDYSLRVSGKCVGIDFDFHRFVVSFIEPPKVQLINLQGVVLQTLQRDQRGYFLFERPLSVYLSRDRIHFYCSDAGKHEVLKIRTSDGTVEAVNYDIRRPMGLIELPDDNVLVVSCDPERQWANAVHHLGPDLRVQKSVLSSAEGVNRPRALCLRQKGTKLFDLILSNRNGSVLSEYRAIFK